MNRRRMLKIVSSGIEGIPVPNDPKGEALSGRRSPKAGSALFCLTENL